MKVEELITKWTKSECPKGFFLHADPNHVQETIESLIENEERYGYMSCPCRLATGKKEEDEDIVCPCFYRDDDVNEFGACYCLLFVSAEHKDNDQYFPEIDERRPG